MDTPTLAAIASSTGIHSVCRDHIHTYTHQRVYVFARSEVVTARCPVSYCHLPPYARERKRERDPSALPILDPSPAISPRAVDTPDRRIYTSVRNIRVYHAHASVYTQVHTYIIYTFIQDRSQRDVRQIARCRDRSAHDIISI